jgi:hypothetical protein
MGAALGFVKFAGAQAAIRKQIPSLRFGMTVCGAGRIWATDHAVGMRISVTSFSSGVSRVVFR